MLTKINIICKYLIININIYNGFKNFLYFFLFVKIIRKTVIITINIVEVHMTNNNLSKYFFPFTFLIKFTPAVIGKHITIIICFKPNKSLIGHQSPNKQIKYIYINNQDY